MKILPRPAVRIAATLAVLIAPVTAQDEARAVAHPPREGKSSFYVGNREPLEPNPLLKLPIGAIRPEGWLRRQLVLQAEGMFGNLPEHSRWVRPEGNAWMDPRGEGAHPWEEMPYWLKGYGDLGYVLQDARIVADTRRWLEGAIRGQDGDGWFGPRENLRKNDLWPNMPMLNAMQSWHEHRENERVIAFLRAYFQWQHKRPPESLLPGSWQKLRGGDNLQSIYWLYNRTGEAWLLDLAKVIHQRTADWTSGVASWHGVNICQGFREPAIWYQQSRDPKHLQAAERNYREVMAKYGQVPGGMFGADENCRPGYSDPRQAAEACSMVELMFTDELLLSITGDSLFADRCEEIAFNSLPAAFTPDLKALHYLTAPNMVQLDAQNHAPGIQNGGCMLAYSPDERYRCCQHNVSHGWPYYAEHLWMATRDDGLAATLYSASELDARVAGGGRVRILQTTDYPFGEEVELKLSLAAPARFPLYLRIPRWCRKASAEVNGKPVEAAAPAGSWLLLKREWREGDRVRLSLPMEVSVRTWKANGDSVSVDRGPLTYSLEIGERWSVHGGTPGWPTSEVHPTTPWNYGLVLDAASPAASFQVVRGTGPLVAQPFEPAGAPIRLEAKGKRIPGWTMDEHGLVATLQKSPARSGEAEEKITLIPMGCARLRLSAFPVIGEGPGAVEWKARPPAPKASHVHDDPRALEDGILPRSSADHDVPRFTWWDRKGTTEWVQYDFPEPRKVSRVEVYWFDDTGRGQCRVPASWRLLQRTPGGWKEVPRVSGHGVEPDQLNVVTFPPVETKSLRIEAKLREGFSAGILEWKVGE